MDISPSAVGPTCANCGADTIGAFCHACGQRAHVAKLTLPHLLHEIPHAVFHLDRGFLPTLLNLARRPGRTINDYLDGRRVRYFNPLTLLVLLAGANVLLYGLLSPNLPMMMAGAPADHAAVYRRIMDLSLRYYSASMLVYLPLAAFVTWLCFLGRGRSYGEHLVINAFIAAFGSLIGVIMLPVLHLLEGTSAFQTGWYVMALGYLAYQGVVLYAIFAAPGRRATTLLRTLAAAVSHIAVQSVLLVAGITAVALAARIG